MAITNINILENLPNSVLSRSKKNFIAKIKIENLI